MPTIQEIEDRVTKALGQFNFQKIKLEETGVEVTIKTDRYDFRETHMNEDTFISLHKAMTHYSAYDSPDNEEDVRKKLRNYRDSSEVAALDFNIRVVEPNKFEYERMIILFDLPAGRRLVPLCYDMKAHYSLLARKTYDSVKTTFDAGNVPSVKLMKQFEKMVQWQINARIDDERANYVDVAKQILHGPVKKLVGMPPATVNYDYERVAAPAAAAPTEGVDNSDFEARFKDQQRKSTINSLRKMTGIPAGPIKPMPTYTEKILDDMKDQAVEIGIQLAQTSEPSTALQHHAEFEIWCEQIYKSRFTNS